MFKSFFLRSKRTLTINPLQPGVAFLYPWKHQKKKYWPFLKQKSNKWKILDAFLWNLWSLTESQFYRRLLGHCFGFVSLVILVTNQLSQSWLSRTSTMSCRKQFKEFTSKMFKITIRSKETFFVAEFDALNSHPEMFCKKKVRKYLAKLTGKHLCRSLSLACRRETLLKKRILYWGFPLKFIRTFFS